jgi:hypothetical protein
VVGDGRIGEGILPIVSGKSRVEKGGDRVGHGTTFKDKGGEQVAARGPRRRGAISLGVRGTGRAQEGWPGPSRVSPSKLSESEIGREQRQAARAVTSGAAAMSVPVRALR